MHYVLSLKWLKRDITRQKISSPPIRHDETSAGSKWATEGASQLNNCLAMALTMIKRAIGQTRVGV